MSSRPRHIFEIYINTTPEKRWQAFTDPPFTKRHCYGSAVESDFRAGSPYRFRNRSGELDMDGTVAEAEPLKRLVTLVCFLWDEGAKRKRRRECRGRSRPGKVERVGLIARTSRTRHSAGTRSPSATLPQQLILRQR